MSADQHGPEHPGHDTHDHQHHHDHAHHLREVGRRRLRFVLVLTATFMVVEAVGGWLANSLALIADAGHMLGDVAALALSLFALWFARRPAPPERSYGYLRLEILAALVNGVALVVISLGILWQARARLLAPEEVEGGLMLVVAAAGLAVNVAAAFLLHSSAGHNLNLRGAYLHVLGDLLGSVGAIAAALVIVTTGWTAADPIISAVVALLILFSAWKLLRESVDVLLESVPRHIDIEQIRTAILKVPGVEEAGDLHVWTLTSGFLAMSARAVIADPGDHQRILEEIHERMHHDFGIQHVTVQIEHRGVYPLRRG